MGHVKSSTENTVSVDFCMFVTRAVAGVILAGHGAQHMFGMFGGTGLQTFVDTMGPVGYLIAAGEFFCGLALAVGLLTRFSAATLILITVHSIMLTYGLNGPYLGNAGFEFKFALLGMLLPVVLSGPGRFSIGRYMPLPKSQQTGRPLLLAE